MRKLIAAILALALLSAAGCTPGAGPRWEWANPRPVGEALTSVTFGDGRYVAVGLLGNIATSTDGEHWEAAGVETDAMLYGVAYGNGRFVAVGTTWPDSPPVSKAETSPPPEKPVPIPPVVYTSRSGKVWQRGTTGAPGRLESVAFGEGHFVAVGNNGIFSSTDGETWTEVAKPKRKLYSVVYGGGRFVAVGMGCAFTSADGINWTEADGIDQWAELRQVTHAQGLFVVVGSGGQILTSADGMTWTNRKDAKLPLTAVGYWQGRFLAVVGRVPYVSTDGVAWTVADGDRWEQTLGAERQLSALAFGGGRFVAAASVPGSIFTSTDGKTWDEVQVDLPRDARIGSLAWGSGRFVGVGEDGAGLVSSDGRTWTRVQAPAAVGGGVNPHKSPSMGEWLWSKPLAKGNDR